MPFQILHHGAVDGVTGSCHELRLREGSGILVDCGMFQGQECSSGGACEEHPGIEFAVGHIRALVVTHVHLDHVGRIPYLMAAGFAGPILCSEPSALLLPLVLEDAVKTGITRDAGLLQSFLTRLQALIVPLPYGKWRDIDTGTTTTLSVKLQPAGHILGSAYVLARVKTGARSRVLGAEEMPGENHPPGASMAPTTGMPSLICFSGDLGAPYAPLLPAPRPPWRADVLVLESTYGDRLHEGRRTRRVRLQGIIETALRDRGVVLIPAFSIGRTQELLYEIEDIIHRNRERFAAQGLTWEDLEIIVDSPLALRYTQVYRQLQNFWDQEAQRRVRAGRHPLSFEQMTVIDRHEDHLAAVDYLQRKARPCVVIAASGMCSGGRIVNYLKALLGDPRTDVVFVGYQAQGTPGRDIQTWGPRGGYVFLEGNRYDIRARIHTLTGYSAHADRSNLVNFVKGMRRRPVEVRLVHGDRQARQVLAAELRKVLRPAIGRIVEHC
ncbi:MBL fold metallo-hydrolase [Syntrophotalea acetylenica]|uniref:MBL fold metallo-hydrolase n=1 Tax=Syntrophotalea acetylenica TaxID=29542 RepID=UPI002A359358|nr:MBL fold metallo-hydrolase [Syntrophotalea acetylenica]MDY0263132.1 MBL fold metallo-hydrolase [Syntrophotalea acetylenica]